MEQTYRAVIADDEPLLRRHLQVLLEFIWPELEVIALASNGEEAWKSIVEHQPEIVFLDIRMPVLDGISLSSRFLQLEKMPLTVFTTAYDQHAVEAFENQAFDYLLKPIEESRLEKTITRLKQRLNEYHNDKRGNNDNEQEKLLQLLSQIIPEAEQPTTEQLKWIRASKQGVIQMLAVKDVDYFLSETKYTSVMSDGEEYLIKTPIITLEKQLDPDDFWRVHRGCIVKVAQIAKVERDFSGHMYIYLKRDNSKLAVSRSYQGLFKQM